MSTIKLNFTELTDLIETINTNKPLILNGYDVFKSSLRKLLNTGVIEGDAYQFLELQTKKIENLENSFDEYTMHLIQDLNNILNTQKQEENKSTQQFEELNNFDPTEYRGGNIS